MKHQIKVIVCVGVINLISRKKIFTNLSFDETVRIIQNRRQMPDLHIHTQYKGGGREGDGKVARHLQSHLHKNIASLCGCSMMKKLLPPSPCPLFSKEKQTWTSAGFGDLHNFHKAEIFQQCTVVHILQQS
jgi:hypothetical protein